jgi:hypothetical protein
MMVFACVYDCQVVFLLAVFLWCINCIMLQIRVTHMLYAYLIYHMSPPYNSRGKQRRHALETLDKRLASLQQSAIFVIVFTLVHSALSSLPIPHYPMPLPSCMSCYVMIVVLWCIVLVISWCILCTHICEGRS